MACQTSNLPVLAAEPAIAHSAQVPARGEHLCPSISFINPIVSTPFLAIRRLFEYLSQNPSVAATLNNTYILRGVFKTAATLNTACDQKFTIDLSHNRVERILPALEAELAPRGLSEVIDFFNTITAYHVPTILDALGTIAGRDLASLHSQFNVNFRLVDYHPLTAAPDSPNGCGAHTDYGTFSIIFQDGTSGLEIATPEAPDVWVPVPGDATVLLCGWCAVVLSGGKVPAVRHRVRRVPGVRRLSAVLFVAPNLDVKMAPEKPMDIFSDAINQGRFDVRWFKEVMGKKWRYREGNGTQEDTVDKNTEQDVDVERLIWK